MPAILGGADLDFTNAGVTSAKLGASPGIFTLSSTGGATVKLTGLSTPSGNEDAANKEYVDNLVQGLSVRDSVRVATVIALTLSDDFESTDLVDGVALATGDRILIKDQTNKVENGIYIVRTSGPPLRASATNSPASGQLPAGADAASVFVFVQEGSANHDNGFTCTNPSGSGIAGATVGTGELVFTQFSSAGSSVVGGVGITKVGNALNFTGGDLGVGTSGVGIGITTTGVIDAGTVNAGTLQIGSAAVHSSASELNRADGCSPGTIVFNKAVVYGPAGQVNAKTLQIEGSTVSATAAELSYMGGASPNTVASGKAVIYGTGFNAGKLSATTLTSASHITSTSGNIIATAGKVEAPTINAATTLQIGGVSISADASEINKLDGVSTTAAEFDLLNTAVAATVVDGKAAIYGTGDKAGQLAAASITTTGNVDSVNVTATGTVGGATVSGTTVNGTTVVAGTLRIGTGTDALTTVTSTATEINKLDGFTGTSSDLNLLDGSSPGTQVASKAVIYGTNKEVSAQSFVASSDRTLKQNIKAIPRDVALEAVGRMTPCTYQFKASPTENRCGVIAQELQEVLPALVKTTAAGTLAVDYNDMNAYLIGAIQALRAQMAKDSAAHHADMKKSAAEAAALRAEIAKALPSGALAELESVKRSAEKLREALRMLATNTPAGGGAACLQSMATD